MFSVYALLDSTIVLSWLVGNPRRFKTYMYVGNRVSHVMELIEMESCQWTREPSQLCLQRTSSIGTRDINYGGMDQAG